MDQKELTERMAIAKIVKQMRMEEGLSQDALAERIKSSRSTIWSVENGESNVGFEVVEDLAKYFQCSIYDLIQRGMKAVATTDLSVEENKKAFLHNLKVITTAKGIKPAQMAKALEVEMATVYSWFSGARVPKREKIKSIAALLKVDEAELFVKPKKAGDAAVLVGSASSAEYVEILRVMKAIESKLNIAESKLSITEAKLNLIDERTVRGFAALENLMKPRK